MLPIAALALALTAQDRQLPAPANLDCEEARDGAPLAWRQHRVSDGYILESDEREPFEGRRSLALSYEREHPPREWGWAYQSFDAAELRGRWARFRAALRVEGEAAEQGARLYVESFDATDRSLSRDDMADRPVRSAEWQVHEVFARVPAEAARIQLGVTMFGRGRAQLDGGSLTLVGELDATPLGARGPWNLDFALGEPGRPWAWTTHPALLASGPLDEGLGRRGLRLDFANEGAESVSLWQGFPAAPFRERLVRSSSRLRVEAEEGAWAQATPWLRVQGAGGELLFLDRMDPVLPGEWKEARIPARVVEAAERIDLGLELHGVGRAYWDALAFDALERQPDPPYELEGRALENVLALARLAGYVRHFHPSDAAAEQDWGELVTAGVRRVEDCRNATELAAELRALLAPIAPAVQVFARGEDPPLPPALLRPGADEQLRVTAWRHRGFGREDGRVYTSTRPRELVRDVELPDGWPDPAEPYEAELPGGVACRVPLALYVGREGTLPPDAGPRTLDEALVAEDRATRLAAVILAWNVPQHFYPYFDVVETDWPAALEEALRGAAVAEGHDDLLAALERMTAHLHDGHARVASQNEGLPGYLPVRWEWIDGRLILTEVSKQAGIELPLPGDEVLRIGPLTAAEAIEREQAFVSAAHADARRDRAVQRLLRGPMGDRVALVIETSAGERRSYLLGLDRDRPVAERRPEVVAELEPGIWYVDLDRIAGPELAETIERLTAARGLVFDLRGYPRSYPMVTSYLSADVLESPYWLVPIVGAPDRSALEWDEGSWSQPPLEPRLGAPVVFLADSRTQSAAETYLSFVEHYRLAEIVGEPTAGTNGNVNPFAVPGGFEIWWTGMRVLKHDRSCHHGVGILPTVLAGRTRLGVIAGRDEVLEAGLELVRAAIAEGRGAGALPRTALDFATEAALALEDGELARALEMSERALELDAELAMARFIRGSALLGMRRDAAAIEELDHALALQPEDVVGRVERAAARYGAGDVERARAELRELVQAEPELVQALVTSGWVELSEGALDVALAQFDAALALERRHADAALGRAGVRYARGELEAALEDVELARRAQRREGSLAPLYEWLLHTKLGQERRAERALELALRRWNEGDLAPLPPLARFLLGERTADELLDALDAGPPWERSRVLAEARFWIAQRLLLEGDEPAAAEHLRACLDAGWWRALSHACAAADLAQRR